MSLTKSKGESYNVVVKPIIDPLQLTQAHKRFEWLINFIICNFRFVHQVLGVMNKIPTPMGTMGVRVVDGRLDLVYNPAFVASLNDEEAVWVFYHEILHVVLHHCTSRRNMSPELWNVAADLAVNELIPEMPDTCTAPTKEDGSPAVLKVSEFKKDPHYKDILEKQTAEWYFDFLKENSPEPDGGKGQSGKGKTGGEGKTKKPGEDGQLDDHDGWREDEIAEEKIRAKVREIDQQDNWGSMSTSDKELIIVAQARKINWRNKIRQFYGNMVWKTRQSTRKRPNRRYGFKFPGSKRILVDRYLVAVDTSGSVDTVLLGMFLDVINGLTDYMPIDLMQFDWDETSAPKPFDRRQMKFEFQGRGGTSFEPVMEAVKKHRYKGVIILTDGCADAPTKPASFVKVLWVLPTGCNPPVEWGERVHMSKYV